jgi:type VI secretion system secreted protein VgrG
MAQLTTTLITIAGKQINQFHSFSLSQDIFDHHYFRVNCPTNAIETVQTAMLQQGKSFLGEKITIKIQSVAGAGECNFEGIVTNIEAERYSGSNGDIVISGYSATKILDSGPHCKTWEKKAVKNIIDDVLKHFPKNLLNPKVATQYAETLAYFVQYKETAWQFLNRICSVFGEWVFFDGKKLCFGALPSGTTIPLIFGSNLNRFSLGMQLRPVNRQVISRDYINDKTYTSKPQGIVEKAGLTGNAKDAYEASGSFYTSSPKEWGNHFLTNQRQLDELVKIHSAMRSAQHVRFNGSSEHPGVCIGAKINVQGQNIFTASQEAYGEFTVISVNHNTDGQGNYTNDFVAIPASIKVPPVNPIAEPACETQSAIVTDNHDQRGYSRIRVKYHWMNGAEKTPWIRVVSPHGGGGKGMHFIPEVGEEVIVGFEGDSTLKPYVIGTVYHGSAKNSYSSGGNDVKALQTRSGNKMVMNDKDGSVHISDKGPNSITFDGAGNALLTTAETITFKVGDSTMVMKKDGTIAINGKDIISIATEGIMQQAKNIGIAAKEKLVGTAKETGINGDDKLGLMSKDLTALGSISAKINGAKVDVSADGNCTISAGLLKLNS